jgi:hypothetical protein
MAREDARKKFPKDLETRSHPWMRRPTPGTDENTDYKGFVRIPQERLIDQKMIIEDIGGEGVTHQRKRAARELDADDMMQLANRLDALREMAEKGNLEELLKKAPVATRKKVMAKGGKVRKGCDGIAKRGKTKGRMR